MTGQTTTLEIADAQSHALAVRRFVRFTSSSLISTAVDQLLAWELFSHLDLIMADSDFWRILIASVVARMVSIAVNFSINSRLVFDGFETDAKRRTFGRFLALATCVLLLSSIGVYLAHTVLDAPEWQAKIVCDLCLFFVNYAGQRAWVFRDSTGVPEPLADIEL